jgi:hypothetical protein
MRFLPNHHNRLPDPPYIVDARTGCWLWQGSTDDNGYGQLTVNGEHKRAHRYYYEQKYGCIPDGLCGCHECDNPLCCNPDHIFLGTKADNMADMYAKGRDCHTKRHLQAAAVPA